MRTRATIASSLTTAAVALIMSVGFIPTAGAADCDGVSFPEHIQSSGGRLTLNGLGIRKATVFSIKVYVGALYLAHPTKDAQAILSSREPAEIELGFVFRVSASQLRSAWKEGFEKNAGAQLPQLQSRIGQLNGWMTGVKSGQRMTFLRVPGVGIEYALDGKVQGTIAGDDFARAFLAIWLGSSPPNAELRTGLLGGACT